MIPFAKYHGLGNDFIIIHEQDCIGLNRSLLAKNMCHRHTGIGADGLIIVQQTPLTMIYYNSDGSIAKMCGNGIRCFAQFCVDQNLVDASSFLVNTLAGPYTIEVINQDPFLVQVNMGKADFDPQAIPMKTPYKTYINQSHTINGQTYQLTSLFMGTTHTVVEVDNLDDVDLTIIGQAIQALDIYPESTNVNFYQILNDQTIKMQTYERGAGLTLACGTGATAVYSVLHTVYGVNHTIDFQLPLGSLSLSVHNNDIVMTGPAEHICSGTYKDVIL